MDEKIKPVLDTTCKIFEELTIPDGIDRNGLSLSDGLKVDLSMFMIYLAMSDGTVTDMEAAEIGEMMKSIDEGLNWNPETIVQIARHENVFSEEFESTPSGSLELAINADNAMVKVGRGATAQVSAVLLILYKLLGRWFINMDGRASKGEQLSYNTYIKMLEDYRANNFVGITDDLLTRANAKIDASMSDTHINSEVDETSDGTDVAEDAIETAAHEDRKVMSGSSSVKKGVKAPKKG